MVMLCRASPHLLEIVWSTLKAWVGCCVLEAVWVVKKAPSSLPPGQEE